MIARYLLLLLILVLSLFVVLIIFRQNIERYFFKPQNKIEQKLERGSDLPVNYEVLFNNLEVPWSMVFLNEKELLITERPGRVKILDIETKKVLANFRLSEVKQVAEGGLLGATLHPNFMENKFVYFYYTTEKNKSLVNRIDRYRLINEGSGYSLIKDRLILDDLPASSIHNGGRIKFGPDGYLYVTVGDAGKSQDAQDLNSLGGKILRLTDDGKFVKDNPFSDSDNQLSRLIYAYGIRNSQGIAWDDEGNLWAIDHGRSGFKTGLDEINLIKKGGNYGWPIIEGEMSREGMISPELHSGPDITWAPADLVYYKNRLLFTGLRGEGLYEFNLQDKILKVHFFKRFGRLRAITVGPDGKIYFSTSNRDGRGYPRNGDDKIIRIDPTKLIENDASESIKIDSPLPNQVINSPLVIKGKAKGRWFFEGTFPVDLVDWDGKIIAEGYVQAKDDWMTDNFVPFEGKLEFNNPSFPNTDIFHFSHRGKLIFKNSNPSGLPENQYYFEVPVVFE
ncbi:MAG: PQQ-dependent sugar dehydrogenase [Patescibacteria group bacterium]|nr:PQQ-dependent sugar dehydrogenase [Patescibacteria group bacterium]